MMKTNYRHYFAMLGVLGTSLIAGTAFADSTPAPSVSREDTNDLFPVTGKLLERKDSGLVHLRGFGNVQARGAVWQGEAGVVSLVRFSAENAASAKIVGAKYLADFKSYGLVQETADAGLTGAGVYTVKDGGVWIIGVDGSQVFVLSGSGVDALRPAAKALQAARWIKPDEKAYPAYLGFFDQCSLGQWWMPGTKTQEIMDFFRNHPAIVNAHAENFTASYAPGVYDTSGASNIVAQAHELGKPFRLMFWSGLPQWWDGGREPQTEEPPARALLRGLFESSGYNDTQMGSPAAHALHLDTMVHAMSRFVDDPSLLGWLEPHGEFNLQPVRSVPPNGPVRFREYLRDVKGYSLAKAAKSYGLTLAKWNELPYPESSDFYGRRGHFIDLDEKPWRWQPGEPLVSGTQKQWNDPAFDDSAWAQDYRWSKRMLSQVPARGVRTYPLWFRFGANVPAASFKGSPKVFLHVMPLTEHEGGQMALWVNGKPAVETVADAGSYIKIHTQFDVTALLKDGTNQFALYSNGGRLRYRVFLSDRSAESFPFKDPKLSQLWIDWSDYLIWEKFQTLETYLRWMRTVDPVHPIKVMTPFLFQSEAMDLFEKYGAYPQLTGEGPGFYRPMHYKGYARLRNLPGSSEPGGAVKDARGAQGMFSNIFWESQDCHDYVFDPARDMWPFPEVVQWWKDNIPLLKTLGKIDFAKAQVGVLRDLEQEFRFGSGKVWSWDLSRGPLPSAGVTPVLVDGRDFDLGLADKVPVIFDCATIIMTPERVRSVLRYVENGGIFVAQHHTGRHTPLQADQWPLAKAFDLEIKDRLTNSGKSQTWPTAPIHFTAEQTLMPSLRSRIVEGTGVSINSLGASDTGAISIQGSHEGVTPIATWDDGTMAICQVQRGKGRIVWLGSPFYAQMKDEGGRWMNEETRQALLVELLTNLGVKAGAASSDKRIWVEKRESKNGLYDVYLASAMNIRGQDWKLADAISSDFTLREINGRSTVFDPTLKDTPVLASERSGADLVLKGQTFQPFQVRQFAVVRQNAGLDAPLHWLDVQQGQWRELKDPKIGTVAGVATAAAKQAALAHESGLDLAQDWKVRISADPKAVLPQDWLDASFDDSAWKKGNLGTWLVNGWKDAGLVQYRKKASIPQEWISSGKRILLGFSGFHALSIHDTGSLWINGKPCEAKLQNRMLLDITGVARSGTLQLAMEIAGASLDKGPGGVLYLRCVDAPVATFDLAGAWDRLTDWHLCKGSVPVPGKINGNFGLRHKFTLPAGWKNKRIRLVVDQGDGNGVQGIFINDDGYVSKNRQDLFPYGLRIDRWLKPGVNCIEIYGPGHQNHQEYKGLSGAISGIRLEACD